MTDDFAAMKLPTRPYAPKERPEWLDYWWDMPAFEMADAMPQYTVVMKFMTEGDMNAFSDRIGVPIPGRSKRRTAWYPHQPKLPYGVFSWRGQREPTRYPVYIPSKGRADNQTTGTLLDAIGVPYHFVVEECEAEAYIERFGEGKVYIFPFSNLGQGSIPARNWIWEHVASIGAPWHWCLDDNIIRFVRCHMNRRLTLHGSAVLRAVEDWVDRYDNVSIAGPHHWGFGWSRRPDISPILFNSRVCSCMLIRTDTPYRWRGRYNEDTDLCLRMLKDGWCTALFRALLMEKGKTLKMAGGNTDNVYNTGDHRRAFAESLRDQHPDVVKVVWRYNRWHHDVDYRPFAANRPRLKPGITPTASNP